MLTKAEAYNLKMIDIVNNPAPLCEKSTYNSHSGIYASGKSVSYTIRKSNGKGN